MLREGIYFDDAALWNLTGKLLMIVKYSVCVYVYMFKNIQCVF